MVKFLEIVKLVPIGIFVVDNNGKFVYVNDKLLEMYGIDIPDGFMYHDVFNSCITDYIDTVDNISININDRLKNVNGNELYVSVQCYRLGEDLIGFCNVIKEIDDDSRYEKLKSVFFSNITHTIRTPLNNIVGFSNLLLEPNKSNIKKKYMETIERNSKLLLESMDSILDITNIGTNDIVLKNNKCVILDIIKEVCDEFKDKLVEGVQLYPADDLTNIVIYSDDERIKHILCNLVSNAVKFTKDGYIRIGFEVRHKNVVFYVEDTGIGIIKDSFNQIFEEFTHSDSRGSGLGLPIVKRLLSALGGDVWLESNVGKGTIFYFTIPSEFSQVF